jgi:denticleless
MVRPCDNWKGIIPSVGVDFNPDPPIFAAKFSNSASYTHILALSNEEGRVSFTAKFYQHL